MNEKTPSLRLEAVPQRHGLTCGLACVAFVTGMSYEEIIRDEPTEKLEQLGYWCYELVEKLHQQKKPYNWRMVAEGEDVNAFSQDSIVFVGDLPHMPEGHYYVKSAQGWMDPWTNYDPLNPDPDSAEAGYRESLPGRAEFVVYPLPAN